MTAKIIDFIAFQLNWFAALIGASYHFEYLGFFTVMISMLFHLKYTEHKQGEIKVYLSAIGIGLTVDTILMARNVLDFGEHAVWGAISPPFMIALWLNFATTLNWSMQWMREKYKLGSIFGAIGGPLAYYGGVKLGAATWGMAEFYAFLHIGIAWAFAMPLLLYFQALWTKPRQDTTD